MTKILTTVILLMLLHFGNNTSLLAQCSATQTQIIIQIFPDTYPQETSWVLATNGGTPLASHTLTTGQTAPVIDTVCLPQNTCIRFTILDTYGDGICCAFGNGHYYVIAGTDTLRSGGSFQRSEVTYIGCNSPGANCVNGLPVAASSIPITAPHTDMWYKFVADSTGNYTLSTCNLNTCNTRLWIYDYCLGLAADTTNQGTYAFNDNACNSNTAEIRTYMVAGNTYYIRVGETGSLCNGGSVVWTLLFNGPIVGCTDPNACTFNPLATVSDTAACLPIGDPNCPPMPDLKVLQPQIVNTLHLEYVNNADQCLVGEGCMAGYGQRELLRFDTHIENIGGADFYLGQPPANASLQNDQWRWDLCHNHWHYEGYAEYVFFDQNNQQIPVGRKNGFCVMDLDCATQGGIGKYNCSNQGITKQCGDIYASYLQCQWVDITAIQPGSYKFIVRVNWQQDRDITGRRESDYHNNWAQVCLNITRDSVGKAHFTVDPNCPNYTDCMGEAFGSAVPDCDGVCNGTRKKGDINSDGNRNISDLNWYLHQALNTTAPATNCTDLSGDGAFDLTDAGNLIDCILHPQGGIAPGHSHTSCTFPYNITNINDSTTLSITNHNTTDHTFDIYIKNPNAKVLGYQFGMSGLEISQVTNLVVGGFSGVPMFNAATNEIIALSFDEIPIQKNNTPLPLCRIQYSNLTNSDICIDHITAVLNAAFEKTEHFIGTQCMHLTEVVTNKQADLNVRVQPNPFSNSTSIQFNNPYHARFQVEITDINGRLLQFYPDITKSDLQISRNNLPNGFYFYRIIGERGTATGKLIID